MIVALLILAFAIVLLVLEDLLPTGGALGLLALACLVGVAWIGFSESRQLGIAYLAAEAVSVPACYAVWAFLLRKTALGRAASLRPPEGHDLDVSHGGPTASDGLVDCVGRATTPLRPSGSVELEGRRHDAIAEAGLISSGSPVVVVAVRSGRLVVRVVGED